MCVCVFVFASKIIYPLFELFSGSWAAGLLSDLSDGSIQMCSRSAVNPHQQTPTRLCPERQLIHKQQENQQIQQSTIQIQVCYTIQLKK